MSATVEAKRLVKAEAKALSRDKRVRSYRIE